MKIAMFVPDLRGGGVERVRLLLAHEFLAKGHEVDLVLLRGQGVLLDQVPADVRVIDLQADRVRQGVMPLVRYLRERHPDALLASMWPLTSLSVLAAHIANYNGRLILSEHAALSRGRDAKGLRGLVLRMSMRWVNGRSNAIVGVSNGVIEDLQNLGLSPKKSITIYNPVKVSMNNVMPESWRGHPWLNVPINKRILSVGRLTKPKDYPTLLKAIKEIKEGGEDFHLLILGVGPLLDELENMCEDLGISNNVYFGGFVADPSPFYCAAGLFVLASAWEGFGNVIVEALASGTPVVATDCPSGPSEILEDGAYGRLVNVGDSSELARAIKESFVVKHDVDQLKSRAADFWPEKVAAKYLELICGLRTSQ